MANLKQNRIEERRQIQFIQEHPPIALGKLEKEKFENPVSNTIYLGFPGGRFPDGFAFRIRFYSDSEPSRDGIEVLDRDQKCFLEIKHKIDGQACSRKKIRHATTVGEAIKIVESKEDVISIFSDDLNEQMTQKLNGFYDQEGTCQPLTSVSYRRTHYIGSQDLTGTRVTLDTDVRSVPIVQYDGVWFLGNAILHPNSVLEYKRPATSYPSQEADISKYKISLAAVDRAVHIEPGMSMRGEGDWVLREEEIKINTISDPRPTLHELEGTDNVLLGPSKEGSSMMQFVIIGDNGICIMGRKNVTSRMAIKFKENVSVNNGVIIKNETVKPYTEEGLTEIIESLDGSFDDVERTAYFTRNRAIRLVVCKDTGNIFAITADRCISEDDRSDLNQVEIEYRGKISSLDVTEVDQDEVDSDFQEVAQWLYLQLRRKKQLPEFTLQTKYEWSSGDAEHQELPEQFGQGNNARIELEDGKVRKSYDLWGAAVSAGDVKEAFDGFHAQVSAIYTVPRLESTEVEGHSLVIREDMIEGVMGSEYLATASEDEIAGFIYQVLSPLVGQIMTGTNYNLEEGKHSKLPLQTPIDIKPDNFIIDSDNKAVFVDMFPPLNRLEDGSLFETYPIKSGKHEAWVYGEASVIITRFLMRCLEDRPEKVEVITTSVLAIVDQIDSSGLLISELKVNANRDKTVRDFGRRVPTFGLIALQLIKNL